MIKSVKVNNSEMEYLSFGTGDKILVIIPGLSLKSVLLVAIEVAILVLSRYLYSVLSKLNNLKFTDFASGCVDVI